nr:DNA-dependent RNA polymerase, mitochondrial [Tanacetum cinerariifolium]
MMDEKGVIEMKVDKEEGAKVMMKHGQYYSQRVVQVACNFKVEDLPLKINLPMVCQPLDWEPINPKFQPKTLADLKGGYLTGRTANISDSINTKDIAEFYEVKKFIPHTRIYIKKSTFLIRGVIPKAGVT